MKHTLWAGGRRLAGADGGRTHSKQAPARTRGEKQPIRLPAADTRTLLGPSSGQTTVLCCSTRLCALRFATARPCSLSRSQPTGRRDARRCTCRGVYTGVRLCGWAMERSTLGAGACVIESAASERTIAAAARSNDAGLAVRGAWQPCMARTNSTVARQRRPRLPHSRLRPVLVSPPLSLPTTNLTCAIPARVLPGCSPVAEHRPSIRQGPMGGEGSNHPRSSALSMLPCW